MTTREQTWDILEQVLNEIDYKRDEPPRGDRFKLTRDDESNYAELHIFTYNINTYGEGEMRWTRHEFVVPVATYNRDTWTRWVFDNIVAIETHETAEWFLSVVNESMHHTMVMVKIHTNNGMRAILPRRERLLVKTTIERRFP